MDFPNLKSKCEYYRSLTDYKLLPNSYVLVMLDGRAFSKMVKNKFDKPFDTQFIHAMNETTRYLCENLQGCKFGYCQSDEISLVISDIGDENKNTSSFFGYRLCKIQSICASMATAKFNQMMMLRRLDSIPDCASSGNVISMCIDSVNTSPLYEFDCKAWVVPNINDAYAWFLYRQLDCIKNSKQQFCQTYMPHKKLLSLHTDAQVELTIKETGNNWNDINNGWKYGRFCTKVQREMSNEYGNFTRNIWECPNAEQLTDPEVKNWFIEKIS